MAVKTPCQTPGATFTTIVNPGEVSISCRPGLDLTEDQAAQLEADLHNVAEMALARWWPPRPHSEVHHV